MTEKPMASLLKSLAARSNHTGGAYMRGLKPASQTGFFRFGATAVAKLLQVIRFKSGSSFNQVSKLSQGHPLGLVATALAHLTRSIAVICLASRINIFAIEDICLTITELTTVKDSNFDHGYHLLSWNQKSPPPKRRAR
jgi:hypothetical protein